MIVLREWVGDRTGASGRKAKQAARAQPFSSLSPLEMRQSVSFSSAVAHTQRQLFFFTPTFFLTRRGEIEKTRREGNKPER